MVSHRIVLSVVLSCVSGSPRPPRTGLARNLASIAVVGNRTVSNRGRRSRREGFRAKIKHHKMCTVCCFFAALTWRLGRCYLLLLCVYRLRLAAKNAISRPFVCFSLISPRIGCLLSALAVSTEGLRSGRAHVRAVFFRTPHPTFPLAGLASILCASESYSLREGVLSAASHLHCLPAFWLLSAPVCAA